MRLGTNTYGLAFFLLSSPLTAALELQTYKLDHLSSESLAHCQSQLQAIATAFQLESGKEVIDYGCQRHEFYKQRFDAKLVYISELPVEITSTEDMVAHAYDERSHYPNKDSCEQDLLRQVEEFKQQTGRIPFLQYCWMDDRSLRTKWGVRIDALGRGERQIFLSGVTLYYWGYEDANAQTEMLTQISANLGAIGSKVIYSGFTHLGAGMYRMYVKHYYLGDRPVFHAFSDLQYASKQECEAYGLAQLRLIFSDLNSYGLASVCNNSSPTQRISYRATLISLQGFNLKAIEGAQSFGTLDACHQNVGAFLDRLRRADQENRNYVGALCHLRDTSYSINAYYTALNEEEPAL